MPEAIQHELIIIGAGPAGMTAGVYAARKQIDTLIISSNIGGQTTWSADIENYLGFMYVSGIDLVAKFEEHLKMFDIKVEYTDVGELRRTRSGFEMVVSDGRLYQARAVILASGKSPKMLNVPGEVEFRNRGVAYCATCDGPMFSGMEVAVVGGGNSGLDAAVQLMKICPQVYIIEYDSELRADEVMQDQVRSAPNVEIIANTEVLEIRGDQFVNGITVKSRESGDIRRIELKGVFVEVGLTPNTVFLRNVIRLNKNGEVPVDCAGRTGIPGLFAAGDVTDVPEKQIIIAAGDGAKAALGAYSYLVRHPAEPDWAVR